MKPLALTEKNKFIESNNTQKPSAFSLFKCKCPRCRKGDMFRDSNPWHLRNTMKMNKECPVCKQPLNIEVGFYYGSSYVSYALTVMISAVSFITWWLIIGFSIKDDSILNWLVFNAVLLIIMQPYLMRVARTGWLAFFVRYNRNWNSIPPNQTERTNNNEEGNW